jgi:putative peptidoglycan lipid II flippase
VAFKIPNFLRRLFAEGAFAQAFVPVLTEYKTKRPHEEVKRLAQDVSGTLAAVLFLVTAVGIALSPILVIVVAPGYLHDQPKLDLTSQMLQITFPYILFISLTALAGGILNSYGQFAVPAFTPVLLNVCMVATAVWLSPYMEQPIVSLAWGVFLAGAAQMMFQLPFVWRLKLLSWPKWGWRDPGVKRIRTLMIPIIFASSVQQVNLLFDVWIASFLVTGSISWLYYADRLVEFPFGVFGVALATVILPSLSAKHAEADPEKFTHTLDWAMRWVLVIGTPAAVGLVALSGPLITSIFQYGQFGDHDFHMTQLALMAYSLGLLGFIYVKVLSPGYFARQDTKTPVKIAIKTVAFKMTLTLGIVLGMVQLHYEAPHMGLALATSISALFNSWLLLHGLRKQGVYKPDRGWWLLIVKIAVACGVMVAALYPAYVDVRSWQHLNAVHRAGNLMLWVAIGASAYFVSLLLMRINFRELLRHKD